MPDSIPGLLELVRQVGSGPLFLAACALILLRVATPDAIRKAIGRVYGDFAPILRSYFRAKSNAREAEAARDRAIESHWQTLIAADPPGASAIGGGGPGGWSGSGSPGALGTGALPLEAIQAAVEGCPHSGCPVLRHLGPGSVGAAGANGTGDGELE